MRKIDEKTDKDKSVFSYERMRFRYEWIKKYYDDGMILDIGCGDGFGAEYFNKKK